MKTRRGIFISLTVAVLSGIFVGVIIPELFRMREGTYAGFFSLYGMRKLQESKMALFPVFWYLMVIRIRQLLFLWMSIYTPVGVFVHLMFGAWLGCSGGMLLSLFTLRQGVQGIGLFFACTLPQWIFYGLQWKRELQLFLEHQLSGGEGMWEKGFVYSKRKEWILWITMVLYCIFGCAAETFIGLWSIKIFLKIME